MKRNLTGLILLLLLPLSVLLFSCKEEEGESYPYALGDIVLSDGTLVHFADRASITDEQKSMVIGVVFYVYYSGYSDEITRYIKSSSDSELKKVKALALGVNQQRLTSWARQYTTGEKKFFEPLLDSNIKVGTTSWTGIYNQLKDKTLEKDDYIYESPDSYKNPIYNGDEWKISESGDGLFEKNNYPAFYYANVYAKENGLSELTFAGDFHLPAIAELRMMADKINIVDPSLDAATNFTLAGCDRFWSASQTKENYAEALVYNFSSLKESSSSKSIETHVMVCFALY